MVPTKKEFRGGERIPERGREEAVDWRHEIGSQNEDVDLEEWGSKKEEEGVGVSSEGEAEVHRL